MVTILSRTQSQASVHSSLREKAARANKSLQRMLVVDMAISVDIYPTMPSRPCRFCLSLQGGSVFADFDVDDEGHAFLQRISLDGYGCCRGGFKKMSIDDSRIFLSEIERGAASAPKIEALLRTYFQENADVIWRDALIAHELV